MLLASHLKLPTESFAHSLIWEKSALLPAWDNWCQWQAQSGSQASACNAVHDIALSHCLYQILSHAQEGHASK